MPQLSQEISDFLNNAPMPFVHLNNRLLADTQKFYDDKVAPKLNNKYMAPLCLAGLQMANDCIWEAHEIVQDIDDMEASYWHAIMHRQEGDYPNASYWYRLVGNSDLYPQILNESQTYLESIEPATELRDILNWDSWDAFAIIEIYRRASSNNRQLQEQLYQLRLIEWSCLFARCLELAEYS